MKNIEIMKHILICAIFAAYIFASCKEEPIGQTATDGVPPGSIISWRAESAPGGAIINYELPDDDDLLYVKAVYYINGVEKKTMSSIYNRKLEIEGFGNTEEQTAQLYCVDRSGNHSTPTEIRFHPDTPPVQTIFESMNMTPGFGGVQIVWENPNKTDVVIYLIAADSLGDIYVADIVYSNSAEGRFNLRGFDTTKRLFGGFIRDKWDNYSDTLQGLFSPLYEIKFDKSKWSMRGLPGDNTTEFGWGWQWSAMYDESTGEPGAHTGVGRTPMLFTLDLGDTVVLSRYTLWHRLGDWSYGHHNPRKWKLYGTVSLAGDKPNDYWEGEGFKNDWTFLMDCYSFKPSGDDNPFVTQEDRDYANRGFEFEFDSNLPPVRYIRFYIESNWSGGDMIHIAEVSFWGKKFQ
ncbi:MAG: DUF4959 domain-containing protein [Prevotellaceae bacterium]|jgi:hypothetical protein|nr:DUF4959 domain-containing protein [Prevotellaceae bacterium]